MKLTRKALITPLLAIAMLAPTGCAGGHWFNVDEDDFEDRLIALEGAYTRGKQAREQITAVGIVIDSEATCNEAWVTTGTRDEETRTRYTVNDQGKQVKDEAFQELRRLSFVNGCMARPNNLDIVAPSASTSPAASPAASPAG